MVKKVYLIIIYVIICFRLCLFYCLPSLLASISYFIFGLLSCLCEISIVLLSFNMNTLQYIIKYDCVSNACVYKNPFFIKNVIIFNLCARSLILLCNSLLFATHLSLFHTTNIIRMNFTIFSNLLNKVIYFNIDL